MSGGGTRKCLGERALASGRLGVHQCKGAGLVDERTPEEIELLRSAFEPRQRCGYECSGRSVMQRDGPALDCSDGIVVPTEEILALNQLWIGALLHEDGGHGWFCTGLEM